jgi:hypothetical protein
MVGVHQQLLVPLNANREAAGWNLDCFYNPIPGVGTRNDRRCEPRDGFAMKGVHHHCWRTNNRRQTRVCRELDRMELATPVMLQSLRHHRTKVRCQTTAIQASEYLHPGADAEDRLVSGKVAFDDGALDRESFG